MRGTSQLGWPLSVDSSRDRTVECWRCAGCAVFSSMSVAVLRCCNAKNEKQGRCTNRGRHDTMQCPMQASRFDRLASWWISSLFQYMHSLLLDEPGSRAQPAWAPKSLSEANTTTETNRTWQNRTGHTTMLHGVSCCNSFIPSCTVHCLASTCSANY